MLLARIPRPHPLRSLHTQLLPVVRRRGISATAATAAAMDALPLSFISGLLTGAASVGLLLGLRKKAQAQAPAATNHATAPASFFRPTPHPDWQPGQQQPSPYGSEYVTVDPADPAMGSGALYPLMISTVVPRPIAFVSSQSKDGSLNLSPYSYFNVFNHNPITICIGPNRTSGREQWGGKKDSQINIEETGEFVVNIMSEWFVEAANHTCGNFDRGVNEMELAGLTSMPSVMVKPPRVAESAVHFECKLKQVVDITNSEGKVTGSIIIAEVVLVHVNKGVATKTPGGHTIADPEKLQAVCRLGGNYYGSLSHVFDIPRPDASAQNRLKDQH